MQTKMIQKRELNKVMKVTMVSLVFCNFMNSYRIMLAGGPKGASYRYSIKKEEVDTPLKKLKTLCGELCWVSYKLIKEDGSLQSKVEEIKKLIAQKSDKAKVFSDKGVDFIILKDVADELTSDEVAQLYSLVVECHRLIHKADSQEQVSVDKDNDSEKPTMAEKISAVATQAKEKVVDIGQKIGKAFKSGSQEAAKKAKGAAQTVAEKAHDTKEAVKAKASCAGEKIKETGEKVKETGEKYATAAKEKVHDVRQKVGQVVEKGTESVKKAVFVGEIKSLKGKMEDMFPEFEKLEDKINNRKSTHSLEAFRDELLSDIESLKSMVEDIVDDVERLEERVNAN